jgi:hypothetical protein
VIEPIAKDLIARTRHQGHEEGTLDFSLMKTLLSEFLAAECATDFTHFASEDVTKA